MKTLRLMAVSLGLMASMQLFAQTNETRIIGHRGGRMEQDENTLAAFKASCKAGISGYETDVRMTKDGKLVVMHDETLDRRTNGTGKVEEHTAAEIRKYKSKDNNDILFVEDLVEFFKDKKDLYVEFEMKTSSYPDDVLPEYCDKVYDLVMKNKPADAIYLLTSFDYRVLRYMQTHHPDADLMLITGKPCNDETISLCKTIGVKRLAAAVNGTSRENVRKAHKEGLILNLWPSTSIDDILLAYYLGADIICTDIPAQAKEWTSKNAPELKVKF